MNSLHHEIVAPQRLMSIDALRGFDMFWIIGSGSTITALAKAFPYPPFDWMAAQIGHPWDRFLPWDLIMPLFLFIVGVAMPFSLGKRLAKGDSKRQIYSKVLRRTVILFFLGMVAGGRLLEYDLSTLRLYHDTLQCIAVGYFFASIMMLELSVAWQRIVTAGLLVLYWVLMRWVPVPGYGAGVFTPDGNLAVYLDKLLLGHFQQGTSWTYMLSSMTFVCSVMLGVVGGQILRSDTSSAKKVLKLTGVGVGCVAAGWVWGYWFPIINQMWTSSMVLFAAGWSFLLLALFYLVIDVWGWKKWAFVFVVIGLNPITAYMASHLFNFRAMGKTFVGGLAKWLGPGYGAVEAAAALTVLWLLLYWMYRTKTFLRI